MIIHAAMVAGISRVVMVFYHPLILPGGASTHIVLHMLHHIHNMNRRHDHLKTVLG